MGTDNVRQTGIVLPRAVCVTLFRKIGVNIKSEIIFKGQVVLREPVQDKEDSFCVKYSKEKQNCGGKIATFKISKIWKGDKSLKNAKVFSGDACLCLGRYFLVGEEYIVFTNKNHDRSDISAEYFGAHACGGTMSVKDNRALKLQEMLDKEFSD